MNTLIKFLASSLVLSSTVTVLSGCGGRGHGSEGDTSTTPVDIPKVNIAFQWVDPIDNLRSSDATFNRAYVESALGDLVGVGGDIGEGLQIPSQDLGFGDSHRYPSISVPHCPAMSDRS
ncbi:hypothetical protein [Nocardia nova]|uniref:hypothetical protein n=1 Tax=Nocardia nova TaxID=37330 RepID=UPI0011B048BD|nr:hypothetical protein [Nocardia nova]